MNVFGQKLARLVEKRDSRLIFNLDISIQINSEPDQQVLLERAFQICRDIEDLIVAVKVGRPFIDAVSLFKIPQLMDEIDVPFIADYKLADVDTNSAWAARHAFVAGFDAVTTHVFPGSEPLKYLVSEFKTKAVLAVVDMPIKSAAEIIKPKTVHMCKLAKKAKAFGVLASPDQVMIKKIRKAVGSMPIFCSGFRMEEKNFGQAIAAGADYEMVGRAIYNSKDPRETAERILERLRGEYGIETTLSRLPYTKI